MDDELLIRGIAVILVISVGIFGAVISYQDLKSAKKRWHDINKD